MRTLGGVVVEALVAYRRRDRLTQNQLVQLLGWHQSHVTRLELGMVDQLLPTSEQLADCLGLVVELRIIDRRRMPWTAGYRRGRVLGTELGRTCRE